MTTANVLRLIRIFRTEGSLKIHTCNSYPLVNVWSHRGKRFYCISGENSPNSLTQLDNVPNLNVVTVKYIRGLPNVIVPLPSRNEKCQFVLRPVSQNVGDFLEMLKAEDRGIDRATVFSKDKVRISAACSIENLMDESFILSVNDKEFLVEPPPRQRITAEELTKLGDVQALISQLYETLHVGEHQLLKERELHKKLETLHSKLNPLEKVKTELEIKAIRRTNVLTWVGLGFMSIQFGILARLTWWEYSWDIMEPVTYFVTYGTAMACYAYYCVTKQEYVLEDVRDRQYLITMHKKAKKSGLDLIQYNALKREIADVEEDLRRLRDPLYLHVPAVPKKNYFLSLESDPNNQFKGVGDEDASTKNKFKNLMETVKGKLVGNTKDSPSSTK